MNNYDHKYLNITYPFGPYIYHCELDPKFIQELIEQGDKTTDSYQQEDGTITNQILEGALAGQLDTGNERQFNPNQQRWFNKNLKEVFYHYVQSRFNFHRIEYKPDYVLENVWINYQHANEYQPDHIHSGDFSWVIYCKIPEGLEEERKNHTKKGPAPGSIVFGYGEAASNPETSYPWNTTTHSVIPKEAHMIIFPAQMRHFVPPFKSEGTRISVSGNGVLYMPDQKLYHMGEKRYEI